MVDFRWGNNHSSTVASLCVLKFTFNSLTSFIYNVFYTVMFLINIELFVIQDLVANKVIDIFKD